MEAWAPQPLLLDNGRWGLNDMQTSQEKISYTLGSQQPKLSEHNPGKRGLVQESEY